MATTYKDRILEQVPTTSTAIYTTPTVSSAHIMYAIVHNESSASQTLTINIVQSGSSVTALNQYLKVAVKPGKSRVLYEIVGRILMTGDVVYAVSTDASSLNLNVGIKEITS